MKSDTDLHPGFRPTSSASVTDPRTEVDLRGVVEKVQRAQAHFHSLTEAVEVFCEEGPYTLVYDDQPRGDGFYIGRAIGVRESPRILGIILGDVLHNLRSALDHLVWQVVLASGNRPGQWNRFPLLKKPEDFDAQVAAPHARGKESPLLGVRAGLVQLFESYQPYDRPDGMAHGFAVLRDLSNVDKHRVVHGTLFAIGREQPAIEFTTGFEGVEIEWRYGPVEEGAEVLRVRFANGRHPGPGDDGLTAEATFTADMRFGDGAFPMSTIAGVMNNVTVCVNDFGSRFRFVRLA